MSLIASELIKESIVIDNAFGFEQEIEVPYKWNVIDRYAKSGFTYMTLSMATDATSLANTVHYLAHTNAHIKQHGDKYLLVKSKDDILRAKQEGRLGISYMFQGINPIEKNSELVDLMYDLGVRSMILSYNARNSAGDGVIEPTDAGLSLFGKHIIARMNQVGMLIDLSHVGRKTSLSAMELSTKPIVFSHSNVDALHKHPRNLTDEQIKNVAQSGGFIGINANAALLGEGQASVKKYVDHIDYIAQLVGVEYVGLGTDIVYFPELIDKFIADNPLFYSEQYVKSTGRDWSILQPEQLIEIVAEMKLRGYTDAAIKKVLGENYLRVVDQVWR